MPAAHPAPQFRALCLAILANPELPKRVMISFPMNTILVTGSCGLIGSEVTAYFARLGWRVTGVDNNLRATFFGPEGDTRWSSHAPSRNFPPTITAIWTFATAKASYRLDEGMCGPMLIVHAAAQPSHDRAAAIPFLDFEVNAVGTLNLLEAARQFCPETPFIHMSTNKVYGDLPNSIPLAELETRWDYADPAYAERHSGDLLHRPIEAFPLRRFQSGGRRHGAGIRPLFQHAHVLPARRLPDRAEPFRRGIARFSQLSGRDATLKAASTKYSATKASRFAITFTPRTSPVSCTNSTRARASREVYNLGGGKGNACSILEAFRMVEDLTGKPQRWSYVD